MAWYFAAMGSPKVERVAECVAECVAAGSDLLGECPLWDERAQALWWVDILAPALKQLDPSSGAVKENRLPEPMGSFAFREQGGLVAAMKSGLFLLDSAYASVERVASPEEDRPGNRFNDGRCDRAGRFWAGTMNDTGRSPDGALYRLSADRSCTRMRSGVIVPNGLAWSPDGRTMYFADSVRDLIWSFDYDPASGTPSNERVFADCAPNPGYPDGACMDAEGCLWSCEYAGWRVARYTPSGRIDRVIGLPVQFPTCCCFGGADFDVLYITSASKDVAADKRTKQPLAGSLFAVRPGVKGLPESRFAG
jgi:sugar lactone lactonase YvrE